MRFAGGRKRRTLGPSAAVALVVAGVLFIGTVPAAAAEQTSSHESNRVDVTHGCKVLTARDLQAVLGGTATSQGNVRQGPDWLCRWSVGANGERPAGTVKVNVAFKVPPGGCDALSNNPRFQVLDGTDGLDDAVFETGVARLNLCKGKRRVAIQGIFNDVSVRPIRSYDAKTQIVQLAGVAQDRL